MQHVHAQSPVIDSLEKAFYGCKTNPCQTQQALLLIETWMDLENMDSAQRWTNKLFSILPGDKQDAVHYYYNSRQSEIYYYSNFHRLGLQNAERGLQIALALQDSIFIADAYNFKGLFLLNLKRIPESVEAFKQGLRWSSKIPHPASYYILTQTYHLLGNIAEALFKSSQYESSLQYAIESKQEAQKNQKPRALSLAYNQIGSCYEAMGKADSAIHYFNTAKASIANDIDVMLLNQASLGMFFHHHQQTMLANQAFAEGLNLLTKRPDINSYYSIEFLNKAIAYHSQTNQQTPLQDCIFKKMVILEKGQNEYNVQINEVMEAALKNETQLLNLRIASEERKLKLNSYKIIALITLLISLLLVFLLYRNRLLKKLELVKLQNNIQQDLHDELGGSLSIIRILSDLMRNRKLSGDEIASTSNKISATADEAAQKMNTLIWALNTENDSLTNLCEYCRHYAVSFFESTGIKVNVQQNLHHSIVIYGTARKNLFLCFKEALHNVLKHATATEVSISFTVTKENAFEITVHDNGRGIENNNSFGNGLKNMHNRMQSIGGTANIYNQQGTVVCFSYPLD